MITMPEHVQSTGESGGWDGTSVDPNTNRVNPNKETAMDWAEHQRIVCSARGLLAGEIEISPSDVKKAFKELKSAYSDADSRSVVKVSKGIHQPSVNPHIQLRMVSTFRNGGVTTESVKQFHLDLSAVDTPHLADAFQWTGVQFSYVHGNQTYKWPPNATPIIRKRERRNSVSSVDLNAHIQRVATEQAEARENEKLQGILAKYAIDKRSLGKLKKGISVPGRDGAYQYGKDAEGVLKFQKTGTKGYVEVD
jgi:hypothetical protein